MKPAIVIPVGPNREENLAMCLSTLINASVRPELIVLVHDGPEASPVVIEDMPVPFEQVVLPAAHVPGAEQPRNVGAKRVAEINEGLAAGDAPVEPFDFVWFVDSDIIFDQDALEQYHDGWERAPEGERERILIGPYDWLAPGERHLSPDLFNDGRWEMFRAHGPEEIFVKDLSKGLGCFSGNLMWPLSEFERVGGFWNDMHHGRCEDGELGLRAVAEGVPISLVAQARGYHLYHDFDMNVRMERNARDVPMIDGRHPWVQGHGLLVVNKDGKRFDQRCPTCAELVNTGEYWGHAARCGDA